LKASASFAVSSRCKSISSENGDEKPNLLKSQRGRSVLSAATDAVMVAWQEVDGADGGDWANAAINAGRDADEERAGQVDALATIRERTERVKKRSINTIEGNRILFLCATRDPHDFFLNLSPAKK